MFNNQKEFINSYDIATKTNSVDYVDPDDLPKPRPTTHDRIVASLTVPWFDPATLPKNEPTTFDQVTNSLRREWTPDGK